MYGKCKCLNVLKFWLAKKNFLQLIWLFQQKKKFTFSYICACSKVYWVAYLLPTLTFTVQNFIIMELGVNRMFYISFSGQKKVYTGCNKDRHFFFVLQSVVVIFFPQDISRRKLCKEREREILQGHTFQACCWLYLWL